MTTDVATRSEPTPRHGSDASVIAASLAEPDLFAEVFDRHFDAIHAFVVRRVGETLGAELASETFLRAFEQRNRFDPAAADDAAPWLFGIATNLLRRHWRSERRQLRAYARSAPRAAGIDDAIEQADARADADALAPTLAAALADLSRGDRNALCLYAWADMDYAAIATALDIPVGTVRSRLNRARTRVRTALDSHGGTT